MTLPAVVALSLSAIRLGASPLEVGLVIGLLAPAACCSQGRSSRQGG